MTVPLQSLKASWPTIRSLNSMGPFTSRRIKATQNMGVFAYVFIELNITWIMNYYSHHFSSIFFDHQECYTKWWFQIFVYFHPYLGKISNLTHIFQWGWNHQLACIMISIITYIFSATTRNGSHYTTSRLAAVWARCGTLRTAPLDMCFSAKGTSMHTSADLEVVEWDGCFFGMQMWM